MDRHYARRLLLSLIGILAITLGFLSPLAQPAASAPISVTLVGDLQDELGCPGDWQPECADTHLTEQGYGVWR
ncbi:MAG: hypothetical protein KAI94_06985, partial [Anaerolineales bacterium]|nr:hypothetical protein [Anaerolineales bacterium]